MFKILLISLSSLLLLLLYPKISVTQSLRIPKHLINCYRGNETEQWNPNSLPLLIELIRKIENFYPTSIDIRQLSVKLLHELRYDGIQRAPGVMETEDVTPYSRNGLMVSKHRVLLQLISNVPGNLHFNEVLLPSELCMLHKMISSSVEPYERKTDKFNNCPIESLNTNERRLRGESAYTPEQGSETNYTVASPAFSRCPLERGVVYHKFGTFQPGTFIASIAAGLQPQNVKISDFVSEYQMDPYENLESMAVHDIGKKIQKLLSSLDTVDNTYGAGLVGDIAEIVLFHMPFIDTRNISIGFTGTWNDTKLPRQYHLHGNRQGHWQMTDTEILAGIDGLFVSQQINVWTSRIRRMRLSQVLELFYINRGITIPTIESKWHKKLFKGRHIPKNTFNDPPVFDSRKNFRNIFEFSEIEQDIIDVNIKYLSRFSIADGITKVCDRPKILELIDIDKLKEETLHFAQILQYASNSMLFTQSILKTFSNIAVDNFMIYARKLVENTPACEGINDNFNRIAVDATIIIDESRTSYENLKLIHMLTELMDISSYGSYISIIHGGTGQYIVNRTNSLPNVFNALRNNTIPNPTKLSLSESLRSLMFELINQTNNEKLNGKFMALPRVILIFSQSQRLTQYEFDSAKRSIKGSLMQFPDLYFIFISNDIDSFKQITSDNDEISISNSRLVTDNSINTERFHFINTNSIEHSTFVTPLKATLISIPKRIISPYCKDENALRQLNDILLRDEFEDYLTPQEITNYRINSHYLKCSNEVRIKFEGVGYGDFTVCMSRYRNLSVVKDCKSVEDMATVWFNITNPCWNEDNTEQCRNIYFTLQLDTTLMKCSESDCRYPDQVRIQVRPEGLRCEYNTGYLPDVNLLIVLSAFFIIHLIK